MGRDPPANRLLSVARLAAKVSRRSPKLVPNAGKDFGLPPEPRPISRRPAERVSVTAASSAIRTAFSMGRVMIAVPRRTRSVRAAA